MKLIDLIQVKNAFDVKTEIANKQVGFKIVKLIKAIDTEFKFYQDELYKILIKYAELDDKGHIKYTEDGKYTVPEDKYSDYSQAITELDNVDVDQPNISFTMQDLEGVPLNLQGLYILYPFITEQ